MGTQKITVTLDQGVLATGRLLAEQRGQSFSEWLSEAAARKLLDDGAEAAGRLFRPGGEDEVDGALRYAAGRRAALVDEVAA